MLRIVALPLLIFALAGCEHNSPQDERDIPVVSAPSETDSGPVVWFRDADRKYGLRDRSGKQILPPTYDDVGRFSEGMAAVNVGAKWEFPGIPMGGKWGYVDESGELRIPVQFEYAYSFSEGLANVSLSGDGDMFIDRNGAVQIRIQKGGAGHFREGLAPISRHDVDSPGTQYINKLGEVVFVVNGWGDEFHEGLAVFSIGDEETTRSNQRRYGYIDKTGKVVIEPKFPEAKHFANGLAPVCTRKGKATADDAWGYINKAGELAIKPVYNEARPFHDGKAMVHDGGRFIMTDDGPCYWEGGMWWLIDQSGKKVGRVPDFDNPF